MAVLICNWALYACGVTRRNPAVDSVWGWGIRITIVNRTNPAFHSNRISARPVVASHECLRRGWEQVTHAIHLPFMCVCVHMAEVVLLRRPTVGQGVLLARYLIQVLSCVMLVLVWWSSAVSISDGFLKGYKWQNKRVVGQPWIVAGQRVCRRLRVVGGRKGFQLVVQNS